MKIQESAENYLEMILMLHKRQGYVRSIDIANELGFSKPSVSVAMKKMCIRDRFSQRRLFESCEKKSLSSAPLKRWF